MLVVKARITLGALLGCLQLLEENRLDRFFVFCHRSSIAPQWIATAHALELTLETWEPTRQSEGDGLGLLLSHHFSLRYRRRGISGS